MIVKWGTYTFDDNAVEFTVEHQPVFSSRMERKSTVHRVHLGGYLFGATQAAITTAIDALDSAFATNGKDLLLYLSDGSTLSSHTLYTSQCIGGTRVTYKAYPEWRGSEYVVRRRFDIVVEGEIRNSNLNILYWTETVDTSGGGPRYGCLECLNGPAQRQMLNQSLAYRARQAGSGVGYITYPPIPAPLWPGALEENPKINRETPQYSAGSRTEYKVSWEYHYSSPGPLFGLPQLPAVPPVLS